MEMSHEKEIIKRETLIIPGIDRGVIPMGIFPEDMSGVMTKYYEKLLPPKGKIFGKLSGFITFLIMFFLITTLVGLLYAMLQYGLGVGSDWFCGGTACAGCGDYWVDSWWEKVNRLWNAICSFGN